jgi:glutathione S-transferase
MALTLYMHPLASFCHKVLIALYEAETAFEPRIVDLADPEASAEFLGRWPVGKIPVLLDHAQRRTVPETSIIIEYLDQHYPGRVRMLPEDAGERLEALLWDRFFDLYVSVPMQKTVIDRIRPEGAKDAHGVAEAREVLTTAYAMIDRQVADKEWAAGNDFSIADCAAAPALFYASIVAPFGNDQRNLAAYFERLMRRPSVARVIAEARPYFSMFPYRETIPARFLQD